MGFVGDSAFNNGVIRINSRKKLSKKVTERLKAGILTLNLIGNSFNVCFFTFLQYLEDYLLSEFPIYYTRILYRYVQYHLRVCRMYVSVRLLNMSALTIRFID